MLYKTEEQREQGQDLELSEKQSSKRDTKEYFKFHAAIFYSKYTGLGTFPFFGRLRFNRSSPESLNIN